MPRPHHWRFRTLILMAGFLGVYSWAVAALYDGKPGQANPRPSTSPAARTRSLIQGTFSFEAERIAMQNGCTTRDGIRPAGSLVQQAENVELYEVACTGTRMRIRCQFENCELAR